VGLGAGTNAMAAIYECEKIYKEHKYKRGVHIISYEKDLDSMRLAVKNPSMFHHVRHSAPSSILKTGSWKSELYNIKWTLIEGNFLDHIENTTPPHCIFFDPFSLKTDELLWDYSVFKRIFNHCADNPSRLFTYSSSTKVRAALLAAGFYTGTGAGTGPKSDTTAAFTTLEIKNPEITLLGIEWLQRFHRSSAKFSDRSSEKEKSEIENLILNHPQFNNLSGDFTDGKKRKRHDGSHSPSGTFNSRDAVWKI